MLIKTGILLSQIEYLMFFFNLYKYLKFSLTILSNILSRLYLHILSFSNPQIFDFLNPRFVSICQNEVLIEERQLMKWVEIFQVGIFWVGIFQGGVWLVEIFPGGIFLEPNFL